MLKTLLFAICFIYHQALCGNPELREDKLICAWLERDPIDHEAERKNAIPWEEVRAELDL